jgi:hypothetical protein
MAAYDAVQIQPEHRRAEFWDVLIDRYLAMELGEFTVTLNRANPATTAEPADEPKADDDFWQRHTWKPDGFCAQDGCPALEGDPGWADHEDRKTPPAAS